MDMNRAKAVKNWLVSKAPDEVELFKRWILSNECDQYSSAYMALKRVVTVLKNIIPRREMPDGNLAEGVFYPKRKTSELLGKYLNECKRYLLEVEKIEVDDVIRNMSVVDDEYTQTLPNGEEQRVPGQGVYVTAPSVGTSAAEIISNGGRHSTRGGDSSNVNGSSGLGNVQGLLQGLNNGEPNTVAVGNLLNEFLGTGTSTSSVPGNGRSTEANAAPTRYSWKGKRELQLMVEEKDCIAKRSINAWLAVNTSVTQYVQGIEWAEKEKRSKNEARFLARAIDLAIDDLGRDHVGEMKAMEALVRRLQALVMAHLDGNWDRATLLEESPQTAALGLSHAELKRLTAMVKVMRKKP